MEETTLKAFWQDAQKQLKEQLVINHQQAINLSRLKVQTLLQSMRPIKLFTLAIGFIWVIGGASIMSNLFIHAYEQLSPFFLYSAALQLSFTALAIGIYLYQLILIHQIDIDQPILQTQETLAKLRASTLWATRVLVLQLPLWTTFYLSWAVLHHASPFYLFVQGVITLSFTVLAVWLFFSITLKNSHKKWFRLLFNGKEWDPIQRSIALIQQMESYKQ